MNVKKLDCPYCGANLKIAPNATHCRCVYCGSDFQIDADVEMEHKTVVDSDGYITLENGERVKPYHNYTTMQTAHRGESREYDFYYDPTGKVHWGAPPVEKLRRVKITVLTILIVIVAFPILGLIWFVLDNSSDTARKTVYEEDFDPYLVIAVSADGVSGSAKLHITFIQSGYAPMGEWTASKETGLKNGDAVTIQFAPKALDTQYKVQDRYYMFTADDTFGEFTYTVSGLNEYVRDLDEQGVSAEDLDKFCQIAEEEIDNTMLASMDFGDADCKVADVDYLGYITRIKKDFAGGELLILYKVTLNWYGQSYEKYVPIGFKDVQVTSDGTVVSDYKPYLKVAGVPTDSIGKTDTFAKPPVWAVYVYGFDSFSTMETTLLFGDAGTYDITNGHYED